MSTTPEKTKRLSIICHKGTKTNYPENKNKIDSDIFGMRRLKSKANMERFSKTKKIVESNIDNDLRSISPYFNGQKNKNYVAPHFNSNINFVNTNENIHLKNISTTPKATKNKTTYNIFNQEVEEKKPNQKTIDYENPPFFSNKYVSQKSEQKKLYKATDNSIDINDVSKLSKNDNKGEMNNKTDKLVCDYCVNGKIIKRNIRERKEKEIIDENENMKKIQESQKNEDNLKNLKDKLIKDRIKQRENLSAFVSNRIVNGREKEKNKLQTQNENDTFILHDREKVNNDIFVAHKKTKQKEVIQEGYLNKYAFKTVRSEIGEYYEKYVENLTITDDETNKQKMKDKYTCYRDGLSKQLKMKKELIEKAKTIDYNTELEIVHYTQKQELKKENEQKVKQNQLKEQFIKENERLRENKKNEQEQKKIQKLNEAKKIELIKKEITENDEKEMNDKKKKNKILMHELDKQINEKMKKRNLSQIPLKDDNVLIKGPDQCLVSCGECNKKFPKKVLNKSNKYLKVLSN